MVDPYSRRVLNSDAVIVVDVADLEIPQDDVRLAIDRNATVVERRLRPNTDEGFV